MHPETHTHTLTSAACGRHPQRCETSCIPHAYITPSPPPPADHSSLYHFILRCEGKAPLLSSLSHWNQPGGRPLQSSMISLHSEHQRSASLRWDQAAANPISAEDFMLVKIESQTCTTGDNIGAEKSNLVIIPFYWYLQQWIQSRESGCKPSTCFSLLHILNRKL